MLLPNTSAFRLLFFLFLIGASCSLFAQKSKGQLELEKKENLRRIAQAEKILTETQSEKKVTIGQLQAIDQQIKARQALINGLNQEISLLESEMKDLSLVVEALQNDLKNLKEEYAAMIYASYKANTGFNILTFIFSANTFNQLFLRLEYLKQYSEARTVQAEQIRVVAEELELQRQDLEIKNQEQKSLLRLQLRENNKLISLKDQKSGIVKELNKKEKQLRTEVASRKKAIDRLDATIAALVRREIEIEEGASSITIADLEELTASFESKKNKLPWPASGFISKKFGTQPHPVLKRIKTENNGVDIQTNGNEQVRSVFDGEVKMVGFLQGMNNFVMVKHGTYFTVYSKLKNVVVTKGQKIKATDAIGQVYTDNNGISELHFEVWRNTEKLDPEKWLVN